MRKIKVLALILCALLAFSLGACTGNEAAPEYTLTIDATDISLEIGQSKTLIASFSNGVEKDLTWSSDKVEYVTVTSGGIVKGIAAGSATISVTDGVKSATCKVTVKKKAENIIFGINETDVSLLNNREFTLEPSATVVGKAVKFTASYESENPLVASVSDVGVIKGLKVGTTKINAEISYNDTKEVFVITVLVNSNAFLTLDSTDITLAMSAPTDAFKTSQTITSTLEINDAMVGVYTLAWTSSEQSVATVSSSGVISAVSPGTAIITASYNSDGNNLSCSVNVSVIIPSVVTPEKVKAIYDYDYESGKSEIMSVDAFEFMSISDVKTIKVNNVLVAKEIKNGKLFIKKQPIGEYDIAVSSDTVEYSTKLDVREGVKELSSTKLIQTEKKLYTAGNIAKFKDYRNVRIFQVKAGTNVGGEDYRLKFDTTGLDLAKNKSIDRLVFKTYLTNPASVSLCYFNDNETYKNKAIYADNDGSFSAEATLGKFAEIYDANGNVTNLKAGEWLTIVINLDTINQDAAAPTNAIDNIYFGLHNTSKDDRIYFADIKFIEAGLLAQNMFNLSLNNTKPIYAINDQITVDFKLATVAQNIITSVTNDNFSVNGNVITLLKIGQSDINISYTFPNGKVFTKVISAIVADTDLRSGTEFIKFNEGASKDRAIDITAFTSKTGDITNIYYKNSDIYNSANSTIDVSAFGDEQCLLVVKANGVTYAIYAYPSKPSSLNSLTYSDSLVDDAPGSIGAVETFEGKQARKVDPNTSTDYRHNVVNLVTSIKTQDPLNRYNYLYMSFYLMGDASRKIVIPRTTENGIEDFIWGDTITGVVNSGVKVYDGAGKPIKESVPFSAKTWYTLRLEMTGKFESYLFSTNDAVTYYIAAVRFSDEEIEVILPDEDIYDDTITDPLLAAKYTTQLKKAAAGKLEGAAEFSGKNARKVTVATGANEHNDAAVRIMPKRSMFDKDATNPYNAFYFSVYLTEARQPFIQLNDTIDQITTNDVWVDSMSNLYDNGIDLYDTATGAAITALSNGNQLEANKWYTFRVALKDWQQIIFATNPGKDYYIADLRYAVDPDLNSTILDAMQVRKIYVDSDVVIGEKSIYKGQSARKLTMTEGGGADWAGCELIANNTATETYFYFTINFTKASKMALYTYNAQNVETTIWCDTISGANVGGLKVYALGREVTDDIQFAQDTWYTIKITLDKAISSYVFATNPASHYYVGNAYYTNSVAPLAAQLPTT